MKKVILLILLLTVSCKTKKIVETHSTDTIYKSEIVKITNPQLTELIIENVCDSLGNLKPFVFNNSSGEVKTKIKTIDNNIYIYQNIDSIKQAAVSEYKSNNTTEVTETIKYKIPRWVWFVFIYTILLTVYTFRKFIPYINLLPI